MPKLKIVFFLENRKAFLKDMTGILFKNHGFELFHVQPPQGCAYLIMYNHGFQSINPQKNLTE
jgi:hypothetical protein